MDNPGKMNLNPVSKDYSTPRSIGSGKSAGAERNSGGIQTLQKGGDASVMRQPTIQIGDAAPTVQAAGAAMILFLCGCCSGDWDCGLQANLQTREEYARFLREHPHYNPYRNWPYMFDPERGGWHLP